MKHKKLHIGCSGWNYDHWKGLFYPEKSSTQEWFGEYAKIFQTVEINNTFYNLPELSVFKKWHDQAPESFIYAVKANRFITHMKKLKDPALSVRKFITRVKALKEHLGPVLFQLPPHWSVNIKRLDGFTDILPAGLDYVFEFRDPSWYDEKVYKLLDEKGISMCLHDMKGSEAPLISVGDICYVRFHGSGQLYGGRYPKKDIIRWAKFIKKELKSGREVYAYFNNDAETNAPKDALRLLGEIKHKVKRKD